MTLARVNVESFGKKRDSSHHNIVSHRHLGRVESLKIVTRVTPSLVHIGVEASKFLGCEGFLPKLFQTCPKSCCATFA